MRSLSLHIVEILLFLPVGIQYPIEASNVPSPSGSFVSIISFILFSIKMLNLIYFNIYLKISIICFR